MRPAEPDLPLRHALALGLLQGPAELLPISSSAHTTLLPWLAAWPYAELDGERRKSFEVALHAGAGLALALHLRRELTRAAEEMSARSAGLLAVALAPAAIVGLALGPTIERRLGGPGSIAAGLAAGAVAMALADTHPGPGVRAWPDATVLDALALGLAQAAALMPGVSRSGATLTAARARGFERGDAQALSWTVALPVILGASALKGLRLARGGLADESVAGPALGAGAAFVSTLASAHLIGPRRRPQQSLLPFAIYRLAVAGVTGNRLRSRPG